VATLTIDVLSPKGAPATLYYRDDTSDLSTIGSTWNLWGTLEDEYGLHTLPPLSGLAVDVGAHIGSIALALLADHPDLSVIAIEPLAENVDMIRKSAERNGWTDRLTIVSGGIAKGRTTDIVFDFAGDEYIKNHRFIGGMALGSETPHQTVTVTAYTLSALLDGRDCEFLKHDCEGCEWALLDDPAIGRVKRIVGEGHPHDWLERVHALLDATHDIHVIDDRGGPGTFRALLRDDSEDTAFRQTAAAIKAQVHRPTWRWES
jgi:FkbM family methyltransferase